MPCRWLQQKIKRYCHITCDFRDVTMLERTGDDGKGTDSCIMPPLLPSLLSACAPSAELKLSVASDQGKILWRVCQTMSSLTSRNEHVPNLVLQHHFSTTAQAMHDGFLCSYLTYRAVAQTSVLLRLLLLCSAGDKFLGMYPGNVASGAGNQLSSFWADLQQHLINLTLGLRPGRSDTRLEGLGSLKALGILTIASGCHYPGKPYHDMSGEKLVLKLPSLGFLCVTDLEDGELVLSTPRVEQAWFVNTKVLQITMREVDDLDCLYLKDCKQVRVAGPALKKQYPKLRSLMVSGSSEVDRLILEDVGQMQRLEQLNYEGFPAACMPASFPQSLQMISLNPYGWRHDLPGGLKQCTKLKHLTFNTNRKSWEFTKPWTECLPLDSLERVGLGQCKYVRQAYGSEATFKQVR